MNNEQEMVQVDAKRLERLLKLEAQQKAAARRSAVRNLILIKKAKDAGITVSKPEVDAWIAEEDARKASQA